MFPSSVIRKLARSEEMLAETHNFVGLGAHVKGPIDIDALSAAYDALLEAHPVLTASLERGPDGRHQIVTDDLLPAGIEVVELDDPAAEGPPLHFDQSESLVHLRVTIRDGQAQPILYVHHSLADGHHMYSLVEELLSYYTDMVVHRKYPSGHRRAHAGIDWRRCSPNGAYTNRTAREWSGSCRRCSPTTFRHPGEPPPTSHLLRPCVFRWCRAG